MALVVCISSVRHRKVLTHYVKEKLEKNVTYSSVPMDEINYQFNLNFYLALIHGLWLVDVGVSF